MKSKLILLGIFIVAILAYLLIEPLNLWVNTSLSVIKEATVDLNLNVMAEYLRSFGSITWVVSFALMVLSCILAPIPAFIITLTNAAVFGWLNGAILSWSSAMVGAVMCFYIARILGRDVVLKIISKQALDKSDEYFQNYGVHTILICRLLPFVSFDLISYAAGLTSMKFSKFFIATGIGQLPATLVYSYFGKNLDGSGKVVFIALLAVFALSIVIYISKSIYEKRKAKQNA
ncbi:TVP38/TMEM64 family protein [Campylobacter geochelonis]|uniref:TVP38/TMEM64 family membrane protein n=1 Tax=Campylobacter geochelonis TaxID=1780362 RepID=A0A128EAB6_9BACT|nr:TVP38/TMEM64 family protein [Campylobacter geochelonis]QKF70604.1 YdjX family membrane protein (SNARE domain) [Campylobacter geochelonis]CZE45946.1 ribosomal protein L22 [Campylobacter geochelonis]